MPLPVIVIWALVSAATAGGAATAAARRKKKQREEEEREKRRKNRQVQKQRREKENSPLKGKKILFIGPHIDGCPPGKTTLATFLSKGNLPSKYEATLNVVTLPVQIFKLEDMEFNADKIIDESGSEHKYPSWKSSIKEADIIFYFIRIDKFLEENEKYESRIRNEIGLIAKWLTNSNKKEPFFIIGSHCDLVDSDFSNLSIDNSLSNKILELENKIDKTPLIQDIKKKIGTGSKVRIVCGSLESEATAKNMTHRILKEAFGFFRETTS